jgi:hypothetical protein
MVSTFSDCRAHTINAAAAPLVHVIHRNADRTSRIKSSGKWEGVFGMSVRSSEAAIDEIVANCNGDLRGALKALLLVNEHLEAEIAKLYAVAAHNGLAERRHSALH